MKAAVFYKSGEPLKIEEVPTPKPGPDEVLVKVSACGLCHTDLHYLDHGTPTFQKPPLILGHEISGVVAEVGDGVDDFHEGDPVLLPAVVPCGSCRFCREGRENICEQMKMYGNHMDGGYAEYVLADARNVFHMPASIPLEEGAVIADAVTTPYHAVINRARVKAGDSVAIIGCGGLGLNTIQFCRVAGAVRIIAVDIVPEKLELAMKLGATDILNALEVERVDAEIRVRTRGGVDVAFECIGNSNTQTTALKSVRTGGKVIFLGYNPENVSIPGGRIMFREIEIAGSLGCRPVDYPKVMAMVASGLIRIADIVSHRFSLDEINTGFDMLRQGKVIRGIVVPGK